MAIINFGSLNLDHVYTMPHFVRPGETISAADYQVYWGGKGLNQSVAAAKAGGDVRHAGMIGAGGEKLREFLKECGVDTSLIGFTDVPQGHALIQVAETGENSIILFHGSNYEVSEEYIDQVLKTVPVGSYVILQNEISNLSHVIAEASRKGCRIVLNPSPFDESFQSLDLKRLDWLIMNEIETEEMFGTQKPEEVIAIIEKAAPDLSIVLTFGSKGSVCYSKGKIVKQNIYHVKAVDTTGAGDTFTGYFVASLDEGKALEESMRRAAAAAAIAVSRKGAAPSIPMREEVEVFLKSK